MTSTIRRARCLAVAGLAASLSAGAPAAELLVRVTDIDGGPVAAAAIFVQGSADLPRPESAVIDQQGKQFVPWVSAVPRGSEIVFTNHDDITHHVYSFSPGKRFSFRLQAGEEQAPMTMPHDGVVVLGCNIHDWMVGYVVVGDADMTATTDAAGEARLQLPTGEWNVRLWHPGLDADALPASRRVVVDEASAAMEFRFTAPLTERGPREPLNDSGYGSP